jgi:hypothetical protein
MTVQRRSQTSLLDLQSSIFYLPFSIFNLQSPILVSLFHRQRLKLFFQMFGQPNSQSNDCEGRISLASRAKYRTSSNEKIVALMDAAICIHHAGGWTVVHSSRAKVMVPCCMPAWMPERH